jgi:hypothetical protein
LTMQPIERDVVEIVFRGFCFLLVFFGQVAKRNDVRMAVERVAVEIDFGIEADELIVFGHHQWIDLQHAHVFAGKGGIELGQHVPNLLGEITGEPERLCNVAAVMRHDAGGRIDREGEDFFRRLVRNFLNVHAAFG